VNTTSIEALFDALLEGDESRLEDLLPPLRVRLSRLAKQRLRDREDAEEVIQETLRTLWERRESIRGPEHLLPFVFQTLRHKIGSTYLRAERWRKRQAGEIEIENSFAGAATVHPEALLAGAEQDGIIVRAIQSCAAENQSHGQVLQLLREGRSAAEIQRELGDLQIAAVRTRICRARKRLREILAEEFHLEL